MSVPVAEELLGHLRDAAVQAVTYVDGLAKEDFLADKRTQQAVILNIIILGEAATNPNGPLSGNRGGHAGH